MNPKSALHRVTRLFAIASLGILLLSSIVSSALADVSCTSLTRTAPSPREYAAMAYFGGDRVLLFGE
jgi:cell division protein FtsL